MKGLVYGTTTGCVRYKFDTSSIPNLQADESYKLRDDINDIDAGAIYDNNKDTYKNPAPLPPRKSIEEWRTEYNKLVTDSDRINKIAQFLSLV